MQRKQLYKQAYMYFWEFTRNENQKLTVFKGQKLANQDS
jgi:hypothetical protein